MNKAKLQLIKWVKNNFNTENTTGLALTLSSIFAGPLFMTSSKMFKWNAIVDYLGCAAFLWGDLYLENGIINDAIKKQIEYSGLSWNIFKRADR